jgi:23S rRNA pseudouridine2605 synthase
MERSDTHRVNKLIAHATGISRREADNAIAAGRVTINGQKAVMGSQAGETDTVLLDGKPVVGATHTYTYLLLNKPVGYVCSRRRQGDYPTIYELLNETDRKLKPVGRLDRDSSGVLLLTDDGDLAHRMTHPKFQKRKVYEIKLDKELEPLHQQMISDIGVSLEDGTSQLTLERLNDTSRTEWRVMMSEGRNRQIRRTFASLGYTVTALHRTSFGPFTIGEMKPGSTLAVARP